MFTFVIKCYQDENGSLCREYELDDKYRELVETERARMQKNGIDTTNLSNDDILDYDKVMAAFVPCEVELEIDYHGEWVDEGIGEYEYWGFAGCDHDWQYEVVEIASAKDAEGNEWKNRLTDEEMDEILECCVVDGIAA